MYTRCIGCHTVHPLNAALLAQGGGQYRCGKCNKLNNALESLFDQWPEAGASPHTPGDVPNLGLKLDLDAASQDAQFSAEDSGEPPEADSRPGIPRALWIVAAGVLALVTIFNMLHLFQDSLLENPQIQRGLVNAGLKDEVTSKDFPDLGLIELVSSEMRSHPDQPGALRLSATITNRAQLSQNYPRLEVVLLDSLGQPIASRVFSPSDYLDSEADIASGMASEAYLPVVLNLADPGQQAVGFELKIR